MDRSKVSHEERTAHEPREEQMHTVTIDDIQQVNDDIRLFRLGIQDQQRGVSFAAGQWLDVFIPSLAKAGGFTITSTPEDALPSSGRVGQPPFLELAIQRSRNPAAAWLSNPVVDELLHKELRVRAGGSFTWPPSGLNVTHVSRIVLIAGGVGINPLISICRHLRNIRAKAEVRVLYATKAPRNRLDISKILFLQDLLDISSSNDTFSTRVFLTGLEKSRPSHAALPPGTVLSRVRDKDILSAIGSLEERANTVCYVCGPPAMTDEFVAYLRKQDGMSTERVLCEKWW